MEKIFPEVDPQLKFNYLTQQDIIKSLTLDIVEDFLRSLGVITIERHSGELRIPTICHNPLNEAHSLKLYWYENSKLFHCYTECSEDMTIFDLYEKFMLINYHRVTRFEAIEYIKNFIYNKAQIIHEESFTTNECIDREKYINKSQLAFDEEIPSTWLDLFIDYYHPSWIKDGILPSVMKQFNIKFNIQNNQIIIPHYNLYGKLIGIRCRELDEDKKQQFGKYHPVYIGDNRKCNHKLGQNLYGIYEKQNTIKQFRRAIIVEGEKSCLLDSGYSNEDSVVVACCGHKINIYQVNLLTKILNVSEIVIAFDKEYDLWNDEDARKDKNLLKSICNNYRNYAKFSYIWDYENLLKRKDSPLDKGKDIWEYLYKNRIKVK